MFGFFRRKPSPYAVAIRDSLINEPEKVKLDYTGTISLLTINDVTVCCNGDTVWVMRPYLQVEPDDRRVIREGIEAWIAWSLTRKETT